MTGHWCRRRTTWGPVLTLEESRLAQLNAGHLLPRIEFDRFGSLSAMILGDLEIQLKFQHSVGYTVKSFSEVNKRHSNHLIDISFL